MRVSTEVAGAKTSWRRMVYPVLSSPWACACAVALGLLWGYFVALAAAVATFSSLSLMSPPLAADLHHRVWAMMAFGGAAGVVGLGLTARASFRVWSKASMKERRLLRVAVPLMMLVWVGIFMGASFLFEVG